MYVDVRERNHLIRFFIFMVLCLLLVMSIKSINNTVKSATDYDAMYEKSFGKSLEDADIDFEPYYTGTDYVLLYDKKTKDIYVRTDKKEIIFVTDDEKNIVYTGYSKWSFSDKYSYFALLNNL